MRLLFAVMALALMYAQQGAAQPASREARFFRTLPDILTAAPATHCGGSARLQNGELIAELNIGYADYNLYNPRTDSEDQVHLRSYNGCPYGPTVTLHPSETIRLTLKNNLPASEATFNCTDPVSPTGSTPPPENHAIPDCFNTTNIHTHGLHVSPSGNSDNVFISVRPGAQFQYEINVPADHPSGTYWYHSHRHGSTAIDVSSGMEGVIIIRGDRKVQDRARNGGLADIDTILRDQSGQPLREQVFLFQQIEYGCFKNATDTAPITDPATGLWTCASDQKGEIRGYQNQLTFLGQAGKSSWEASGRFTQINGEVQPQFPPQGQVLHAGEIQRWRMVHGGIRDTLNIHIVRASLAIQPAASAGAAPGQSPATQAITALRRRLQAAASPEARESELALACNGETVAQEEIAADGLTRTAITEKAINVMQPGYRTDVLVAFPRPGLYCLLDDAADISATLVNGQAPAGRKNRRLLGFVMVAPGTNIPGAGASAPQNPSPYAAWVRDRLLAANSTLPPQVKTDLHALKIAAYAPVPSIPGPANIKATDTFDIDVAGTPPTASFSINEQHYDPNRIDYAAPLGSTDQWTMTNNGASHVFHIHVNPFQIVDILDPSNKSILDAHGHCTELDLKDAAGKPAPDPQYCDQIGIVRDTIFIKGGPAGGPPGGHGYTVVMRTRYDRYVGEFVMHCHILDHEDQGMMENVLIVPSKDDLPSQTAAATSANSTTAALAPPHMHH